MIKDAPIFGHYLAFVIAHPDDESYLAAGTIRRNQEAGGQTMVICATAGERGRSHLAQAVATDALKQIRQRELQAVAKLLRVQKLVQLDVPDSEVNNHLPRLLSALAQQLTTAQPDYIFSFGPDGVTGHLDHIAVGQAAKQIAAQLNVPFLSFCRPSNVTTETLQARQRFGSYASDPTEQRPNVEVAIDPKIKMAALCCHGSQIDAADPLADFPEAAQEQLLHHEYFYADWL